MKFPQLKSVYPNMSWHVKEQESRKEKIWKEEMN